MSTIEIIESPLVPPDTVILIDRAKTKITLPKPPKIETPMERLSYLSPICLNDKVYHPKRWMRRFAQPHSNEKIAIWRKRYAASWGEWRAPAPSNPLSPLSGIIV